MTLVWLSVQLFVWNIEKLSEIILIKMGNDCYYYHTIIIIGCLYLIRCVCLSELSVHYIAQNNYHYNNHFINLPKQHRHRGATMELIV